MPDDVNVRSPDDPAFHELCRALAKKADEVDATGKWPAAQLRLCAHYGVWNWFLPFEWQGDEWSDADLARGYMGLAGACLTTAFIITQRTAAVRRILASSNDALKAQLLPGLRSGERFATVGISQLTTSHQHADEPVLRASETSGGYKLHGFSPWVTGAAHADTIAIGAVFKDGRELLVALPTDLAGVSVEPPLRLLGVGASATGQVRLDNVVVPEELVLAGPIHGVLTGGAGSGTGGLQTSSLAVGLAGAAIDYLDQESAQRPNLVAVAAGLRVDQTQIESDLLNLAAGEPVCTQDDLRARANSLALRASQAALGAAKGAGYVWGHRAGRYCREALFFLVWSCPHPVMQANLCELAGLE
ncbi:MAG: acyl-CoA/acyl-ACP dehydrogenase [Pirellulales bacterium]|nr:acyl-CoA/acyl-ACP dehydrogenase [Pirellulales bacterium]